MRFGNSNVKIENVLLQKHMSSHRDMSRGGKYFYKVISIKKTVTAIIFELCFG